MKLHIKIIIILMVVVILAGISGYFLGAFNNVFSKNYKDIDQKKGIDMRICSLEDVSGEYNILEADFLAGTQDKDFNNMLSDKIKNLKSFQYFSKLYPSVRIDTEDLVVYPHIIDQKYFMTYNYLPNSYFAEYKDASDFYRRWYDALETNSFVISVRISDYYTRVGSTAGEYSIYIDMCNDNIMDIIYCSSNDCSNNL